MRTLVAFLRRELRIELSYASTWVFAALSGGVTLAAMFFLSRAFGGQGWLLRLGRDYFSFGVIGIAVSASLRSMQTSFASRLREAQSDGSLEVMLATPLSTVGVIAGLAAYPILSGLVREALFLAAAWALFGAHLSIQWVSLVAILAVSTVAFAAIGLLSAGFVLIARRSDPFSYLLDSATYLLSGVLYPVEVLPSFLQGVSKLLPATYAIRAMRAAALDAAPLSAVGPDVGALALYALVLWPLAAFALGRARMYVENRGYT